MGYVWLKRKSMLKALKKDRIVGLKNKNGRKLQEI